MFLSSNFLLKDVGVTDVILGIRMLIDNDSLILSQSNYIELLKKTNHLDCDPASTSFDPDFKLESNTGKPIAHLEHAKVIRCLMYAMTCTRPDIVFAIGKLSRYTNNLSNLN